MYYILLDGDNIQWETYIDHVKDAIEATYGDDYKLTVFVQTNVLIKYRSTNMSSLNIKCSATTGKNASDVQVVLETGKLLQGTDSIILIVSNDKIFDEICDNKRVFMFGYTGYRKRRILRKRVVLNAMKDLSSGTGDVCLNDLYEHLNCGSISSLKEYINKFVPEMYVAANNAVFYVKPIL
jgi:hypothetical protein